MIPLGLGFLTAAAQEQMERFGRLAAERELRLAALEYQRAAVQANLARTTKQLIRGVVVEVVCPACYAVAVIGDQEPIRVEHVREGCAGTPFLRVVQDGRS